MQDIHDQSRPNGMLEAFRDYKHIGSDSKDDIRALIAQANTVDISTVIASYGADMRANAKYIICPFPSHKEKSPSFSVYRDTNSYFCFGCKSGGGPVCFVHGMEGISKPDAARKLIDGFSPDPNFVYENVGKVHQERQNEHLAFSDLIHTFIRSNSDDDKALIYAEKLCLIFDTINNKHNLEAEALRSLIAKLKVKLGQYTCQ